MSFSVFERKFGPIEDLDPDKTAREQYEELQQREAPLGQVWSIVEAGDDWYYLPGYHVVNMMGYAISAKPWTIKDIEEGLVVKW